MANGNLVISRKRGEDVWIEVNGERIRVQIVNLHGSRAVVAIVASLEVRIVRGELVPDWVPERGAA
jgi:sRNA-binding carbon storage regulator CsrA